MDGPSGERRGMVALLAAVTAMGPLSMQVFLPALPAVEATFAADPARVQLTLSLAMLASALATLAWGPLSDRFGRRPTLLAGLGIFVAGSVGCALAPTLDALVGWRVVQSAGGAAGMVLARAIVRDRNGPDRAAAVIAQLTMVMVAVPTLSPAVGGLLTDLAGWRSVFVLVTAAGLVMAVVTALRLDESRAPGTEPESPLDMLRGFAMLLGSARYCGYALQAAFGSTIFFSFVSGASYLMGSVLQRPASEYGLLFILASGGFMVGNFLSIRLGRRHGPLRLTTAGALLGLVGVLATMAAVAVELSPWTLFGPAMLAFIGNGLAMPNAQAGAINVFPWRAGTASGFAGFLQMLFAAVATQAIGVLHDGTAWPMLAFMLIGATGAVACSQLVVARERVHARG